MAKALGQIHTVNQSFTIPALAEGSTPFSTGDIDVPGLLTDQLSRMVRAGNMFKTVGIDISLGIDHDLNQTASVRGTIRYYAPTRGRCAAFRSAFKAMAEQMANQGISMRDNKLYDFRAPLNETHAAVFANQATLDGTNGLALNHTSTGASIFAVHNRSVQPTFTGTTGQLYDEGFSTLLQARGGGTDFVLNEAIPYTGSHETASLEYETIPFALAFGDSDESSTLSFQWRPDPALYLAVLCGQFQIVVEDMNVQSSIGLEEISLNVAVMVSGWKSIMGNPDKKKGSSKKRTRK
ncbi:MAG: hypothetical protein [Circular genetic element sp.]|nr:MAG: hypothetical protein [Circular genetic element sp.]